jgi:uncharacterized ParB-like nuclease family protein
MPFKSQAQRRKFYAMERAGEISPKVLKKWEDATPKNKKLPERVKTAGGPGSGVGRDNTAPIAEHELKQSDVIRIGKRKDLMSSLPCSLEDIAVNSVSHACQSNYVPSKLNGVMAAMESGTLNDKPVDLLKVSDSYHVLDGHHRVMAAKRLGKEKLKARVYSEEKTATDYTALRALFADINDRAKRDAREIETEVERTSNRTGEDMKLDSQEKTAFELGFEKRASHAAEILGLATLAAPSVQSLRGKPMSEHTSHKMELAGLGILGAPSAYAIGKKLLTKGK